MPPEYCEFSACYADKCRAWLEKHHPELLGLHTLSLLSLGCLPPPRAAQPTPLTCLLVTRVLLCCLLFVSAPGDVTAAVAKLSLGKSDKTEGDSSPAVPSSTDEKKAPSSSSSSKPSKPRPAADDSSDDSGSDDSDAPAGKSKGSAAAAIRTKAPATGGVLIRKEERTKRKFTTSVKGMDAFGCDLKKAAKVFSKKFACSASVVKVNEGGLEIQIQGDVQMELPDVIMQEFPKVTTATLPRTPASQPHRSLCVVSRLLRCAVLCAGWGGQIDRTSLFFVDKANKKTRCF